MRKEKSTWILPKRKSLEKDGIEVFGLAFRANIHRDIKLINQQERIIELKSIITSWKDDLKDFYALIDKFDFQGVV